jgi:hypothetical protein
MTENQNEQLPGEPSKPAAPGEEEGNGAQPPPAKFLPPTGSPVDTSNEPDNQTTAMEVHHSHHPTHKKKWTEYLLEFFMLFFAVFLGFLVENFREHQIEEGRAEKHMYTMVQNLKYDTTRYGGNYRSNVINCKGLDSFRNEIKEAIAGKVNANRLYYYYLKYGRSHSSAVTNSAAMTQLKSSGMIRMIKEDSLVAQMGDYYERMYSILEVGVNAMQERREDANELYKQFFSYLGFEELIEREPVFLNTADTSRQRFTSNLLRQDPPLKLYSTGKVAFQQLYDAVAAFELTIRAYNSRLRYCYQGADRLMSKIQAQYEFE